MKITEYKTKLAGETGTIREYLQFREKWGILEVKPTDYLLMLSQNGDLILNKTFNSRSDAKKYAVKKCKTLIGVKCFTIMKENKIIERMEAV